MNKIEELIKEYCPDGVEYKELGEICISLPKGTLKQTELVENSKYPVINSGKGLYGYYFDYNNEGNTITIASRGEYAGYISFMKNKFWAGGLCYPYTVKDTSLYITKYLFYYLKHKENYIMDTMVARGSIPALNKKDIEKIEIPIPPIAIQEEIVNILDTFTELEAELEAELVLRKKQYEYYRDKLLTFSPGDSRVKWVSLSELGIFIRGNGLQKKDFTSEGVGCIHYGQIYTYYKTFTDKTKSFVSKQLANKLKKAKPKDLIIATTSENVRDVAKAVAWLGDEEICISGDACIFRHNQNSKYMSYLFQTQSFFKHKKKYVTGTKVIRINNKDLGKFYFPIPQLEEQERIVNILDKFESLVNDISIGLPAEINARQQQYKYYRNKLLSFNKI